MWTSPASFSQTFLKAWLFLGVVFFLVGASLRCSPDACTNSEDCKGGQICLKGRCQYCAKDEECPSGQSCQEGTCQKKKEPPVQVCSNDSDCDPGMQCQGGRCTVPCTCPFNQHCDEGGQCVPGCLTNDHCKPGNWCRAGQCVKVQKKEPTEGNNETTGDGGEVRPEREVVVSPDQEPPPDLLPDPSGEGLPESTEKERCQKDQDCETSKGQKGWTCVSGFCEATHCPAKPCPQGKICKEGKCDYPECNSDADCHLLKGSPGWSCEQGICRAKSCPANPCKTSEKCLRGRCVPPDYCDTPKDCQSGQKCLSQKCVDPSYCQKDADCSAKQQCDNNKCIGLEDAICNTTNLPCKPPLRCHQGYCRQGCDFLNPSCPAQRFCVALSNFLAGVCLPGRGGQPSGKPCDQNKRCEVHLTCITAGSGSTSGICAAYCDRNKQSCGTNQECLNINKDPIGACIPVRSEGQLCSPSKLQPCASKLFCIKSSSTATDGTCRPQCDPLQPSCKSGTACAVISGGDGACLPKNNGKKIGQSCSSSTPCEVDLLCINSVCRAVCDRRAGSICSTGLCVPISGLGNDIGACI